MSSFKSVRWVTLDVLISRGLAFLSFVLVGRILGPESMGVVAVIMLVKELSVVISDFGLSQAIIHFPNPTSRQLATLYSINWMLGFFFFCAVQVLAEPLSQVFDQKELAELLPWVAVVFLMEPVGQQVNALLQKSMEFNVLAGVSIFGSFVNASVAIIGVYNGFGLWSIVAAGLLGSAVRQTGLAILARRRKLLNGFALDFANSKPLLRFGLYRTGATGLTLLNSRVDQVIVGAFLGSAALGLYSMAMTWTLMIMQQINSIATKVAFPAIARFQSDKPRVRHAYFRLVNRVTTVNAALFIGLAIIADPAVHLVLGPEWESLVPVLRLMCIYVLLRSLGNLNGPLSMGLGKADWAFYWNLALLLFIPPVIWLSAQKGILEYVLLAQIGIQATLTFFMYFYWTRRLIGPCAIGYAMSALRPALCGCIMGLALHFSMPFMALLETEFSIALSIFSGGVIYLAASLVFNREGIQEVLSLVYKKVPDS